MSLFPTNNRPYVEPNIYESNDKSSLVKDLTDDELEELAEKYLDYGIDAHDWKGFARAVLRKAQEK